MKFVLICGLFFLMSCAHKEMGKLEFPKGEVQQVYVNKEAKWSPCPGTLPQGCQMSVVEGSPAKPGFFTVRFKLDKGFKMLEHFHSKEERVTVLSGKWGVSFKDKKVLFNKGDHYITARDIPHKVWAEESSVIQIIGIGPWSAKYTQ